MRIVGLLIATLTLVFIFFNGIIMLFSPALWFKLPSGLTFRSSSHGILSAGTALGRIQVRILGLVITSLMGSMALAFLGFGLWE